VHPWCGYERLINICQKNQKNLTTIPHYAILPSYIILTECCSIVTENRHPMRLNVGFLINSPIGTSRDFHFEFPRIHLQPDLDLNDLIGVARIGRTPQGLLVQGKFQARFEAECVRCLREFEQPLDSEFSELYAFNRRSVSESGLIVPEDGKIDLEPLIREYLVIEIPISPLCKIDCKGLCSICGADLNEMTCEHQLHNSDATITS